MHSYNLKLNLCLKKYRAGLPEEMEPSLLEVEHSQQHQHYGTIAFRKYCHDTLNVNKTNCI